jgi:hypothetical protein
MCGEGASPPPDPAELESCVNALFEVRSALTLNDFCSSSPNESRLSLAEAITGFADSWDTPASTSPECDDTPAYFEL